MLQFTLKRVERAVGLREFTVYDTLKVNKRKLKQPQTRDNNCHSGR